MYKVCPKCEKNKDAAEFNKNSRRSDGLQAYCRVCQSEVDRKFYATKGKAKKYDRIAIRRHNIRAWLSEYKRTLSCLTCGNSDPRVLGFCHKDDDRSFSLGDASHGFSLSRLEEEIQKCRCLCGNCQRIEEYENRKGT
jgi:hypothetical protein